MIKILSEQHQGKTINEICREYGISQSCILQVDERIRQLEYAAAYPQKNPVQYKKIVAELMLEDVVMKDAITKKR